MVFDDTLKNHFIGGYIVEIPALSFPLINPEISKLQNYIAMPINQGVNFLVKSSDLTLIRTYEDQTIHIDDKSEILHKWYDPFVFMEKLSKQRGWDKRPEIFLYRGFELEDNLSMEYSIALSAIYAYSLVNNVTLSIAEVEQLTLEILERLKFRFRGFKVKSILNQKFGEFIVGNDNGVTGEIMNTESIKIYHITRKNLLKNEAYTEFIKKLNSIFKKLDGKGPLKYPYNNYNTFYSSEPLIYKKMVDALSNGNMEVVAEASYDSALGIRDSLRITSNFQNELSHLMDSYGIIGYFFNLGEGEGGITAFWDHENYEKFVTNVIRDYFLRYGISLIVREIKLGQGVQIKKIPIS